MIINGHDSETVEDELDLDAFAQILSAWLTAHHGSLPAALALDGKMIRDTIGVLSVVDVETGVPASMRILTQKEGDGERCEKIAARHTLTPMPDGQGSLPELLAPMVAREGTSQSFRLDFAVFVYFLAILT